MKPLLLIGVLVYSLTGCRKTNVESGEVAALFSRQDLSYIDCVCCTAYRFQIDSASYGAEVVPAPYNGANWPFKINTPVWIRYRQQLLTGTCAGASNHIQLISIRERQP